MICVRFNVDITGWLEATWVDITVSADDAEATEKQIRCVSYHPTQIADLRVSAKEMKTPLDAYENLLQQWQDAYVSPTQQAQEIPSIVTIRQARRALLDAGLLDEIEGAISIADRATQVDWESTTEVHRDWPLLGEIQRKMGLSDAQIDEHFLRASNY